MQQMLPSDWVDSLFTRLQVRYGAAWNRMWEGIDIGVVKAEWAEELGGFAANPTAIKRALGRLPADWPPNVAQFKALCIGREGDIEQSAPRLPAPPADRERVNAVLAGIKANRAKRPPRQWANELRKREQAIDRTLSPVQKMAWREALREHSESNANMTFSMIDPACLPPGMRGTA